MSVSNVGLATFGSAAIASPANDANVKCDDKPADESAAQQLIEAAKAPGTGQLVDQTA